ncbi:hypothetical protein CBR_g28034 [Chara braunii]|uniref:Uncharacterized protein n=1 Tax=Chara braunii TaxID=69332 RepID=A0A388L914_CHABU|nr:hypothetical protein CBR_g28034 [Chara braunii]|eukprot:GBG78810.1 hypothetical protein CBR_g28034 [Chara braunii]
MYPCLGGDDHHPDCLTLRRSCGDVRAAAAGGHSGDQPVAARTYATALIAVAAPVVAGSIVAAANVSAFAVGAAAFVTPAVDIVVDGIARVELAAGCGAAPHIAWSARHVVVVDGGALEAAPALGTSTAFELAVDVVDIAAVIVVVVVVDVLVADQVVVETLGCEQPGKRRGRNVAAAVGAVAEVAVAYPLICPGTVGALDTHPCVAAGQADPGAVVAPWENSVVDHGTVGYGTVPPTPPCSVVGPGAVELQGLLLLLRHHPSLILFRSTIQLLHLQFCRRHQVSMNWLLLRFPREVQLVLVIQVGLLPLPLKRQDASQVLELAKVLLRFLELQRRGRLPVHPLLDCRRKLIFTTVVAENIFLHVDSRADVAASCRRHVGIPIPAYVAEAADTQDTWLQSASVAHDTTYLARVLVDGPSRPQVARR